MTKNVFFGAGFLASTLYILSPVADAATEDGSFAVRGLGSLPCADLSQAVGGNAGTDTRADLAAWIAGYLSMANRMTPSLFDAVPVQDNRALASLVVAICRDNPNQMTETVLATVVESFSDAAARVSGELIEISVNDRTVRVRQPTILAVQERLVELGHLSSDSVVDGVFGPNTRGALEGFQASKSLNVTGLPDSATLIALFVIP